MVYIHCRSQIQVPTRIRIPNPMSTLYYAVHVHVALDLDLDPYPGLIPQLLLCPFLEQISEPGSGSESGNVNEL